MSIEPYPPGPMVALTLLSQLVCVGGSGIFACVACVTGHHAGDILLRPRGLRVDGDVPTLDVIGAGRERHGTLDVHRAVAARPHGRAYFAVAAGLRRWVGNMRERIELRDGVRLQDRITNEVLTSAVNVADGRDRRSPEDRKSVV